MYFESIDTIDPEVARMVSHNFDVAGKRLQTVEEYVTPNIEGGIEIPDKKAIIRIDTNQYLGTVGINWEPVQPKVLYEMAGDLIVATSGSINGVLNMHNGAVIGISFKLADREYVDNDRIDLNFLMLTAFNGMYGLSGSAMTYRHETESIANTSNKVFNLKHTKFVGNRIEVVKDMLKYYNQEITSFDTLMNRLVTRPMSKEMAIEWFKSLFPAPRGQRSELILEKSIDTFTGLLNNQRRIPGVYGTSYGAWCALTEYVNHNRIIRVHNNRDPEEVRFQTINFGTGNTLIQKGIHILSQEFEFDESEFMID